MTPRNAQIIFNEHGKDKYSPLNFLVSKFPRPLAKWEQLDWGIRGTIKLLIERQIGLLAEISANLEE